MSDGKTIHEQTLAALGSASPDAITARFAEVRARFDGETGGLAAGDMAAWTALRVASSVLDGQLDGEGTIAALLLVGVLHALTRSRRLV